MTAFADWFFSGLGGPGGWVLILPVGLIAAIWLFSDSTRRYLPAVRWRLSAWLPAILHLPLVWVLTTRVYPGDHPGLIALASLTGSALAIGALVGYMLRFRGLEGCDKGHGPYPVRLGACPVCARQTVPGVPGYVPDLGPPRADTGQGRTSPGSPRKPRIKVDAWLVTADGHGYQLNARETLIGRNSQCDIRLWDTTTSRNHARIIVESGTATIYDLGSVVGTFLNGQRVRRPETLSEGDVIAFGSGTRMTFTRDPNSLAKPIQ